MCKCVEANQIERKKKQQSQFYAAKLRMFTPLGLHSHVNVCSCEYVCVGGSVACYDVQYECVCVCAWLFIGSVCVLRIIRLFVYFVCVNSTCIQFHFHIIPNPTSAFSNALFAQSHRNFPLVVACSSLNACYPLWCAASASLQFSGNGILFSFFFAFFSLFQYWYSLFRFSSFHLLMVLM